VPEGDTIWRVAARLAPALVGAEVVRFAAPRLTGPAPALGSTVGAVDAVGKHLLVTFSDGVVLQVHLRMTGSWHLYRPGQQWTRPRHQARVEIETRDWLAVCFAAPVVRSSRRGPAVAHLGPDLTAPDADVSSAAGRAGAEDGARPIVDVLLDQRVAAGIGNVYKNELLWRHRYAPLAPVGALDRAALEAVYADAHRLLRRNLGPGARTTVVGVPGGLAVYRRAGRPCLRCGGAVERAALGSPPRSTYWCPRCQVRGVSLSPPR